MKKLTVQEKQKIRVLYADPIFNKVLSMAEEHKPSVLIAESGLNITSPEMSQAVVNNRFHQLQGWEMFKGVFLGILEIQKNKTRESIRDDFPDEGRVENT
mgnify:FL=1|jgi:hypothetical protein